MVDVLDDNPGLTAFYLKPSSVRRPLRGRAGNGEQTRAASLRWTKARDFERTSLSVARVRLPSTPMC